MLRLIATLCTYVFPERPDHRVTRLLTEAELSRYLRPSLDQEITSLLPFRETSTRALIHEAKFHGNERAWELLGGALSHYLKHVSSDTVLIPIPLSAKRRRARGYNQVEEVAKRALKHHANIKLELDLLIRTRDTKAQTSLDRGKRIANVADAFGIRHSRSLEGLSIIILDDVATTGATLKAARKALIPLKPASITLLALAH